jgi:hypothetical protein
MNIIIDSMLEGIGFIVGMGVGGFFLAVFALIIYLITK